MTQLNRRSRDAVQGWGFLSPALAVIGVFIIGSIFFAVYLSFHRVNLFQRTYDFVGFQNYARMIQDTRTIIAFRNTFRYVLIVVPTQTFIALVLGFILSGKIKGKLFFRTIYFLPTLTSSAALTMIFMFLFSLNGPVNSILSNLNLISNNINFLNDPRFVLNVIIVMNIWSTVPFFMTIYIAALSNLPADLYEAAEVDGANVIQKFRFITVPFLRPVTTFVVLTGIIGTFQIFDQAFIISNGSGGPENATLTVTLLIWRYAFGQNNLMGLASSIAILLAVVIFVISFIANKINKYEALY
jgi:multiple sugar transport system permease protein/raffinose/stachyose/melibiose transport system permease protein